MKKTVWLLIIFLALGGIAYKGFKDSRKSKASAALTWERDFKIKDISKVWKIFIADKRGKTATLDKQKDGTWKLDGDRTVSPFIAQNMLEIMESMEYQYLLGEAEEEGVVKRMITSALKVEMYDEENKEIITFYVGPNARNHEGTYFMREGSDHPQLMNMPGFVGDLRPRFEISKEQWWSKTVIGVKLDQIEEVKVFYYKQKSKSFTISRKGSEWEVLPLDPLVPKMTKVARQDVLVDYLEEFKSKGAAGFRNEYSAQDSIIRQIPFAEVTVKRKGIDQLLKVNFFPIYDESAPRDDASILASKSDVLRLWAKVEDGDFFTTQLRVFSPLFRSYQSFF